MKKELVLLLIMTSTFILEGKTQELNSDRLRRYFDLTAAIGQSQGTVSATYGQNWKLWKKQKWEMGLSARWSTYFGSKTDFITAPARLARTNTIPFLIFFAGQKTENHDTLTVQHPLTASLNLVVNAGYNLTPRWYLGFNIDVIGFTFGRRSSAILTSNGVARTEPRAKPVFFNLLLTGDHDLGSLNSEFFIQYRLKNSWNIKAVYQFIFIEYVTQNIKQTAPDGTMVDRFRNKANAFGLGVAYNFKNRK